MLGGCASSSPLTQVQEPLGGRTFGQAERDQTFVAAQLYIFSGNMAEAEKILKNAERLSKGEEVVEFQLMLCRVQTELGKIEEAYKRYVQLTEKHPQSEAVLKDAAQFFYGIRLKADAYRLYSHLTKINPKESNYWIYRGLLALELADAKEAWDSFDFLIRKSTDAKHLGHLYMGKLMQMTGFTRKAGREFKKCLSVRPETRDCQLELARKDYDSGHKKKARRALKDYLVKYKFRGNRALADQLIDWHIQAGDLQSAILEVESLERVSPADINIKRKAAMLLVEYKNYDAALERMEIVVQHDHANEQDNLNYANILHARGDVAKATRHLALVSAVSTKSTEKTFFRKFEMDEEVVSRDFAMKSLNKVCRKSKKQGECLYVYSYLLWESGKVSKARRVLEKALRSEEDKTQKIKYFLSQIYYDEGKKNKSMKLVERIIAANEAYAPALNFKAYHMAQEGMNVLEAERLSLRAVSIQPDNGHYLDTYGYILLKRGLFKEASIVLEGALKFTPEEPEVMEHLADAYVGLGKFGKALKFYALASELYKGKNQDRVGGKIAQIRSKRSISSVPGDTDSVTK